MRAMAQAAVDDFDDVNNITWGFPDIPMINRLSDHLADLELEDMKEDADP